MPLTTRPLLPTDAATLDAFLAPHTAEAYYLRSNAMSAGLVYEGRPLQAEYFGAFDGESLVGVITYTWRPTILVFAEDPACLPALGKAVRPAIVKRGGNIEAILGLAPHVDAVISALALPREAFRKYGDDWLFRLDLKAMRLPPLPESLSLRLAEEKDRALLIDWRMAFNIEANNAEPGPNLKASVEKEVDHWLKSKQTFMLENTGNPVSFCGIGGTIPETVIIGPVWTPVELRNRGYGRLVTGHGLKILMQERPALREATLFASRPDAIRVYESLGFTCAADWRLALLREDYRVEGAA